MCYRLGARGCRPGVLHLAAALCRGFFASLWEVHRGFIFLASLVLVGGVVGFAGRWLWLRVLAGVAACGLWPGGGGVVRGYRGGVGVRAVVAAAARALGGSAAGAGHRWAGALVAGLGAHLAVAIGLSGAAARARWRRGAGRRRVAQGAGLRVGGGVVAGCRGVGQGARRPGFLICDEVLLLPHNIL